MLLKLLRIWELKASSELKNLKKFQADFGDFDPMLSQKYTDLNQDIFTINIQPEAILEIDDIATYNKQEGLALSDEEVIYLENLSKKLNRKLTDSESFCISLKSILNIAVTKFSTELLSLMALRKKLLF